ncbi:zf-HC2 domain-containing protein [Streptomyces sp. 7N604]|uniref:zf-HC2 domain-containing protein n=1 Tax=Streptomyces sp. 7N604 TaxID=3457415 RepID=UPI003FD645BD
MTGSGGSRHVEQHLGDRLAALVDGELEHDARERVLAHLATCGKCKAEADAQRRLKSVFAETAPPPPSEGLLARLQGLPGADDDGPGGPGGPGDAGNPFGSGGVFGVQQGGFAYVPSGNHGRSRESGFRIHDVERPGSRGRRFAFAAAGAVSLAAIALGGALPLEAAIESAAARGEGPGAAATPARTAQAGGAASVSGGDALLAASGSDIHPFLLSAPAGAGEASAPKPTAHPPYALPHHYVPRMLPTAAGPPLLRQASAGPQNAFFGGVPAAIDPAPAPTQLALPSASPEH